MPHVEALVSTSKISCRLPLHSIFFPLRGAAALLPSERALCIADVVVRRPCFWPFRLPCSPQAHKRRIMGIAVQCWICGITYPMCRRRMIQQTNSPLRRVKQLVILTATWQELVLLMLPWQMMSLKSWSLSMPGKQEVMSRKLSARHKDAENCNVSNAAERVNSWLSQRCGKTRQLEEALIAQAGGLRIGTINAGSLNHKIALLRGLQCEVLAVQEMVIGPSKQISAKAQLKYKEPMQCSARLAKETCAQPEAA